jgi:hypothetical protein
MESVREKLWGTETNEEILRELRVVLKNIRLKWGKMPQLEFQHKEEYSTVAKSMKRDMQYSHKLSVKRS